MLTLGIDPGTARMGWGIVETKKRGQKRLRLIEWGCVETVKEMAMPERLWKLHKELKKVVKEYQPEEVVVERLFFNANVKTAIAVGQARGVAMLVSAQSHLPLFEYTALEAKLVLTGYGRSDKKLVQQEVEKLLGITKKITRDDAADALAIALCHLYKNGSLTRIK